MSELLDLAQRVAAANILPECCLQLPGDGTFGEVAAVEDLKDPGPDLVGHVGADQRNARH